jgi:hypothetical protein
MEHDRDRPAGPATAPPEGRLPYEKPSVAWEQPLEAQPSLMSGCQKVSAADASCNATGPLGS